MQFSVARKVDALLPVVLHVVETSSWSGCMFIHNSKGLCFLVCHIPCTWASFEARQTKPTHGGTISCFNMLVRTCHVFKSAAHPKSLLQSISMFVCTKKSPIFVVKKVFSQWEKLIWEDLDLKVKCKYRPDFMEATRAITSMALPPGIALVPLRCLQWTFTTFS